MEALTQAVESAPQPPFIHSAELGVMVDGLPSTGVCAATSTLTLTSGAEEGGIKGMTLDEDPSPLELSDNDLLMRIAADQDRQAFARLFEKLAPRIKAYMMKLGARPEFAEEVVQETFITVWRKAGQFDRKKSSAVTWIFTIARNQRIDRLRKENRPALDPNEPMLVPGEPPDPLSEMEQSVIVKHVTASINELPADQQEVIRLSFIDGLSHKEISDRLDLPLGTVKSRLRLSFEKLRVSLGVVR